MFVFDRTPGSVNREINLCPADFIQPWSTNFLPSAVRSFSFAKILLRVRRFDHVVWKVS